MAESKARKKSVEAPVSFEAALERLGVINESLESGDATLEDAIDLYTEGMELVKFCQSRLSEAEKRIKIILEKDGESHEGDLSENP